MKKINLFYAALCCLFIVFTTGCKKDNDPTPDANPGAPVATVTMTDNATKGTATLNVSTTTGTAKIRLDVSGSSDLDKIYIMKSEDNGTLVPQSFATITNSSGITFTGGSSTYSFAIPGTTKNFILDIPVSVRNTSAAVTDVYYIWITNGTGDYLKPTKKTIFGPSVVTLNYTASPITNTYSTGTVNLGDQTATPGSLLVTSGQIGALLTADYIDAPQSADLSLSSLNAAGDTKQNGSGNLFLISPSLRSTLTNPYAGCATCSSTNGPLPEPTSSTGANVTYIATYSGGTFEAATGADLAALSVGTGTEVQLSAVGDIFKFQTSAGKKGLIKITALNTASGLATVSVKVLN